MIINGKDTRQMKSTKEIKIYQSKMKSLIREVSGNCSFVFQIKIKEALTTDSIYGFVKFHNINDKEFEFSIRNHGISKDYKGKCYYMQKYKTVTELQKIIRADLKKAYKNWI